MKIIKRNGAEVPFDITKIITAVTKASDSVGGQARLSREQITQIAAAVTDQCQQLNRAVSVEEVQDLVENQLMDIQAHDVARHYITYRYVQSLKRQTNTTDERILSLIECQNEEVKQENANKNPTVNSVQRDYMAGEISKDLTARLLLDPEIVKAHQEGLIHFHDSDYFAQHMHNCDLVNLEDMLQNGTVISGTYIEKPHSFSTACNIATQIIAQVASNQYGGQSISLTHLAPFVDVSRKKIAAEVELEMEGLDVSAERKKEIVERRLRNEINRGVQTIQYQVVTLMTTNGQAPFITVFMYLGEARNPQEKADLAIIIEETIRQRYQGVKNEYPVRAALETERNKALLLTDQEAERLTKGEVIRKAVEVRGEKTQQYLQLDPETKSVVHRRVTDIQLEQKLKDMEKLIDIELGTQQKQQIREGKPVELNVGGEKVSVGVDLKEPQGFKVIQGDLKEWERQQKLRYDEQHPEYLGLVMTDKNRWEYRQVVDKQSQERAVRFGSAKEEKSKGLKR